jgi:predicted phage baseplate assembly protein
MRWGDLVVAGDARRREILERHRNGVDGVEVREGGRRLSVYFLERPPDGLGPGNVRIDAPRGGRAVRAVEVRRAVEVDPQLEDRLIVELDHPGSAGYYHLRIVERNPDGRPGFAPYRGIDPKFAGARFVFDVEGPRPPIVTAPAGTPAPDLSVSYLYRDYAGLRQLMLDRLAATMPEWSETHEPDMWITLVELLAYIGDDLSYYEDAVATEAYLQTARNRVSVRRHARLVDYRLHEGCNARAWVCVDVTAPVSLPLDRVRFATAGGYVGPGAPVIDASMFSSDTLASFQQYSPLSVQPGTRGLEAAATLLPAHNAIDLWSWGELDSQLVTGATTAVLRDGSPASEADQPPRRELGLRIGDVLVLEEIADPQTQGLGPADPTHRQAVRLTGVRPLIDHLYGQPLLEVQWAPEDALTFELAVMAAGRTCGQASGNVLLVANAVSASDTIDVSAPSLTRAGLTFSTPFPDPETVGRHQARRLRSLYADWRRQVEDWQSAARDGTPLSREQLELLSRQVGPEELPTLGLTGPHRERDEADRAQRDADALAELLARAWRLLAGRRRRLAVLARLAEARGPLEDVLISELEADWGEALVAPLSPGQPGSWGPAAVAIAQDPRAALPVLVLTDGTGAQWSAGLDLIGVAPAVRAFVAEVNDQGIAGLRINDPPTQATLTASYWVGNGTPGNAEAEAINAIVWLAAPAGGPAQAGAAGGAPNGISLVRNPLPVTGGIDAETVAAAKLAIPGAFMNSQPRALTAADYATLAEGMAGVRAAAAELRSTGSLTVVEVAVAPKLGEDPSSGLLADVGRGLDAARRIGHVVQVVPPRYRPLLIVLQVALAPTAIRAGISYELARLLSSGWRADGTPALFNPAELGFAKTVYSSPILAAVHAVDGVESVTLTRFGFLDHAAAAGAPAVAEELTFGTLEIARLDNDPIWPEHGYALVTLEGGR